VGGQPHRERRPGREPGHRQPVRVQAELAGQVGGGGQHGGDLPVDRDQARLPDGLVLGDDPGQPTGRQQPAPAGVLPQPRTPRSSAGSASPGTSSTAGTGPDRSGGR
jgi:hypothetical protein